MDKMMRHKAELTKTLPGYRLVLFRLEACVLSLLATASGYTSGFLMAFFLDPVFLKTRRKRKKTLPQ